MLNLLHGLWIPRCLCGVEGPGINPGIRTGYQDAQSALIATSKVAEKVGDKPVSTEDAQVKEAQLALGTLIKDEVKVFGKESPEVEATQKILDKLKNGDQLTATDMDQLQGIVKKMGQKLVETVSNKKLIESMPADLKATIASSPNADRAMETYARLKELQQADKNAPKRPSDAAISLLAAGVATPARVGIQDTAGILGQDGAVRAAKALQAMPDADYNKIGGPDGLLNQAKSDPEKQLILKVVGSTPGAYKLPDSKSPTAVTDAKYNQAFMQDLEKFAQDIRGSDKDKLMAGATLPGSLKQFLECSCGPTTLQMLLETLSPITARHLNENAELREQWQREVLAKYGGLSVRREDAANYSNLKVGIAGASEALTFYPPNNPYSHFIFQAQVDLQKALGDTTKGGEDVLDQFRKDADFKPSENQKKLIGLEILRRYMAEPDFNPRNDGEKQLLQDALAYLKDQKPPVDIDKARADTVRQKFVQNKEDQAALELLRTYMEHPDLNLSGEQVGQIDRAKVLLGARSSEAFGSLQGDISRRLGELQDIQGNDKLPQAKKDKAFEEDLALSAVRRYIQDPTYQPEAKDLAKIQKGLTLLGADKATQIVALHLSMTDPQAQLDDQKVKDSLVALGLPADATQMEAVKKQAESIKEQVTTAKQGLEGVRKGIALVAAGAQEPLNKQVAEYKRLKTDIDAQLQELGGKPPAPALETLKKYLTDPNFKPDSKQKVQIEAALRYLKEKASNDKDYPGQPALDDIRATLQQVYNNDVEGYKNEAMASKKPYEQALAEAKEKARQKLSTDGLTTADVYRIAVDKAVAITSGGGEGMALDKAVEEMTGRPYNADFVTTMTDDPASKNFTKAVQLAHSGKKLGPDDMLVIDSARKMGTVHDKYLDKSAKALAQGQAVPIRIGYTDKDGHATGGGHFLLTTNVTGNAPNRQFRVADPWTGTARWVTEKDLKSGNFAADPKYGFNLAKPPGAARVTHMFTPKD